MGMLLRRHEAARREQAAKAAEAVRAENEASAAEDAIHAVTEAPPAVVEEITLKSEFVAPPKQEQNRYDGKRRK